MAEKYTVDPENLSHIDNYDVYSINRDKFYEEKIGAERMFVMLEALVEKAKQGNADALDEVVRRLTEPLYNLALRMLYHPQDAEDALQEILIKIVTHLGNFKGRSAFKTYAFRIAVNHLRTARSRRREFPDLSFEEMSDRIVDDSPANWDEQISEAQQQLFVRELLIGCLQALLLGLDREQRLAYILVEVLDLTGTQAAIVLDLKPATFRKRLSRARNSIRAFMTRHCALVRPENRCHCDRQAAHFSRNRGINTHELIFSNRPHTGKLASHLQDQMAELEELRRVRNLFRNSPDLKAPGQMVSRVRDLLSSGKYDVLRLS